jgi:hypothetical protein
MKKFVLDNGAFLAKLAIQPIHLQSILKKRFYFHYFNFRDYF